VTLPVESSSVETVSRPLRWPGRGALGAGILTILALITGLVAAWLELFEFATYAAGAAIGLSAVAVVGGIVAAIGNWDRGAAIGAIVVGALANPLVLLYGLNAVAGLDAVASA
jgi:hypothetical protein